MAANSPFVIRSYGAELRNGKRRLLEAFESRGLVGERRALLVAMAMIETTRMSPKQRDSDKDKYSDKSANASIFNLNEDLLRELGYRGDIHKLDSLGALPEAVGLINKGFDTWGVPRMLNFVRGGRTAFVDGTSYGAAEYRSAVATILKQLDTTPGLLSDDRRVEIDVQYQDHLRYPERR